MSGATGSRDHLVAEFRFDRPTVISLDAVRDRERSPFPARTLDELDALEKAEARGRMIGLGFLLLYAVTMGGLLYLGVRWLASWLLP